MESRAQVIQVLAVCLTQETKDNKGANMTEKEEALVDGFASPLCVVGIKTSNQRIEFIAEEGFEKLMNNPLKTDNGLTVGERNRVALHRRLDAWIDGTWQEDRDE